MTVEYKDSKRIVTSPASASYWDFDGTNDYVQMPTIPTGYTFAVSMWLRKDSSGRMAFMVDNDTNGIWLEDANAGSTRLRVGHSQSGSDFDTSTAFPEDGNFHHLVFNVGTPNQIWLDGVSLGTGGSANSSSTNWIPAMGARKSSSTTDRFLDGAMSKVGIWDRKLTDAEVASLYAEAEPSTISSGLLATYNFEQSGNTLEDQTNSYDGTNNGATTGGTRDVPETKPTDVQDNSLLVEKDTARRYWFDAEGETETESTGTYSWTGDIGTYDNNYQGFYVANSSSIVYGKTIESVSFWLHKTGSPTGTATVGVWSNSGSGSTKTLAHTFGTLDVSTLTGSFVKYTFDTGSHTLAVGDTVGIYSPTTNVNNTVEMQGSTSGQYDDVNTIRGRTAGGTWSPVTTHDIRFTITETTPTWTMQPTKQFDFSSSTGWVPVGSNITVTGGAITASAMVTQGSANRIYYDLGSALSDKFIIDFDHYAVTDGASSGAYWQMFALTDTTAIPRTDDSIYPLIDMGSWDVYLRYGNEGNAEVNVGTLGSLTTGQWQYVRFVRDGTTGTLTVYNDSARTDQKLNVSGTIPATVTGLRYFQSGSLSGANNGTATYKIDNLKIYDGVTSIT